MDIVWLGHSCFRIRGREATIVMDPCPPASGYAIGKPTGDIVTVSHPHDNHNFVKAIAGSPTVLDSPGEYEIHGVFITGVRTYHDVEKGAERGGNLAWVLEMEGMKVCHLGDLGHSPSAEQAEEMTGADVLMVPVGGETTIDGRKAAEIVALLEARVILPMHYQTPALKGQLETPEVFLKEMGVTAAPEPQQKLSITRTTVPSDAQVVLLDYRRP
jgi:L-ascorbate metabolism protein UlaG (beta-lactamase superfamily)